MLRKRRLFHPLMWFGSATAIAIVVAASIAGTGSDAPSAFHIAHLSPDAPPVDVYVDDVVAEAGLAYGQIGALHPVPHSGPIMVVVRLAGTGPDTQPLLTAEVHLAPGANHVIAIANILEHLQIGAYVIPTGGVPADRTRIQVLHAIPNAPRIGVRAGPEVVANELGYLEDPVFLDVPTGQTRLIGFTTDIPALLLFDQDRALQPGTVETVILTGFPAQVLILTSRP